MSFSYNSFYSSKLEEPEKEILFSSSPPEIFSSIEEELKYLKERNVELKAKLKKYKLKIREDKENKLSPYELTNQIQKLIPKFLKQETDFDSYDDFNIDNKLSPLTSLNNQNVENWTVIDNYNNYNSNDEIISNNDIVSTGPYILLKESDVIDSIACYVAQCVIRMPQCKNLNQKDIIKLLDTSFNELKEKGPLSKMYGWGKFLYSTYGWTSTVYGLYTNPVIIRIILSCLWTSASWLGILAVVV